MGVLVKENQALGFDISTSCGCGGDYCQPIQTDDSTYLQTILTAANNNNLCPQGEFDASSKWNLGSGFSIAGGKLVALNVTGNTASSETLGLVAGRVYLIQTSVTITSGSPASGDGWNMTINAETATLPDGNSNYNQSLTASWLYKPTSIGTDRIEFTADTNFGFEVAYIRVYEFSTPALAIYDTNNSLLASYTTFTGDNSLKLVNNGAEIFSGTKFELFEGEYAYNGVSVYGNIFIDNWASLTGYTGCIYVKIFDAVYSYERVRNGTFNGDLNLWEVGDQWEFEGSGKAHYNPPSMGAYTAGVLEQDIYLLGGTTYTLSFFLTDIGFDNMQVLIDKNDGNGAVSTVVTGVQTPYTMTIDMTAFSGVQTVTISFGEYTSANEDFKIDTVSITADNIVGATSECIDLQTTHNCTLLFVGNNNDNAFGFDFSVGFRLFLRVYGKLNVIGYPEEVEGTFRFSDGSLKNMYAVSDKEYEVVIGDAAEYIHDCLRLLRLTDIFTIDGTEYVRTGDYGLKGRKSSDLLQATFNVKPADGLVANYSCS